MNLLSLERPNFSTIKTQNIVSTLEQAITDHKKMVDKIVDHDAIHSFDSLVLALDKTDDRLSKAWSPIHHLNSVCSNSELRKAHDDALLKITSYCTGLKQNEALYGCYRSLADSNQYLKLNDIEKKIIDDALLDFKLGGISLEKTQREKFATLKEELSRLNSQFSNNVLDATMAWSYHTQDVKDLEGLPKQALDKAQQVASEKDQKGYILTLEIPCYIAVMTHCSNRELRQTMYKAYNTRASDQCIEKPELDNSQIIDAILSIRHQLAQLLDFDNYAQMSLARKMAPSTDDVLVFLNELAEKTKPQAKEEFEYLKQFAKDTDNITDFQPFDISYYSEKLKQKDHNLSQEELRPYFPLDRVLHGLFAVSHQLFGIEINEVLDFDRWHADVQLFQIRKNQDLMGEFYLDLYARPNKQGGAWMDNYQGRMRVDTHSLQKPIAYLTCNFNSPAKGQQALLTHNEVVTLFHEFGHGLHHLLTEIDYLSVSGINGVEWDAVELPSQFMENFCWQSESIKLMSQHHETHDPLPDDLLDRLLATKTFQSGIQMLRQLELALFDFMLHLDYPKGDKEYLSNTLSAVRSKVALYEYPKYNRFAHAFSHIFAGGYAAGYYSYKWAEVLSADAFSVFEQQGILNKATGSEFLTHILSRGGSMKALDLFKAFMGREPNVDALLRHSGIVSAH